MSGYYICNGITFAEQATSLHPENRSFRYGDGLFETIRFANGMMPLWDLHAERLFNGLSTLQVTYGKHFTPALLRHQVVSLCEKNRLTNARIRITVSRGEGGILEPTSASPDYIIQTWPLDEPAPRFNTNGLHLQVYEDGLKPADTLSNLKSTNYLVYAMAALHAKQQKANDAIVLNHHGRIADCSIANIFWVDGTQLFTTPLSEGPVAGVMRKYLLSEMKCIERPVSVQELQHASEVFITNAVRGIQWVGQINGKDLSLPLTSLKIYQEIIVPLFAAPQTK